MRNLKILLYHLIMSISSILLMISNFLGNDPDSMSPRLSNIYFMGGSLILIFDFILFRKSLSAKNHKIIFTIFLSFTILGIFLPKYSLFFQSIDNIFVFTFLQTIISLIYLLTGEFISKNSKISEKVDDSE